jgi:acyl dehydratase
MPIDYQKLRDRVFPTVEQSYDWKDSALYALAIGYASNPLDEAELRFVYEQRNDQLAAPTMPVVLATPGFWAREPDTGIDWVRMLHGEQKLVLHRLLPAQGTVTSRNRITAIVDKGAGKGALVVQERTLVDKETGELIATLENRSFCRGDGGFSDVPGNGPQGGDPAPEANPNIPNRAPDRIVDVPTLLQSALIYRLCADFNPLHADPAVARAAGFKRPILHGLASFSVAGYAVLKACCDYDPTRLKSIGLRFAKPVLPGDTLRTEIWVNGKSVQFRVSALERSEVVLSHGIAETA